MTAKAHGCRQTLAEDSPSAGKGLLHLEKLSCGVNTREMPSVDKVSETRASRAQAANMLGELSVKAYLTRGGVGGEKKN